MARERKLEDPTKYTKPDGVKDRGRFRWTADQQETLKRLSSDGTIKGVLTLESIMQMSRAI